MLHLPVLSAFRAEIICENDSGDARLRTELDGDALRVYLTARESRPTFVRLAWDAEKDADTLVLGDAWERSYGDLEFKRLGDNNRRLPWYFIATDRTDCFCFGVKTRPHAFVSFRFTLTELSALLDCRNGGGGVALGGREIFLAEFVLKEYKNTDDFDALCDFCGRLCPDPILPDAPVFGNNNWYYAYGKSSREEILADARMTAELAKGLPAPAYEVIDDCWQLNSCAGPWLPNEKFGDMKTLADEIHAMGLRAGIWVRLLSTKESLPDDMLILRGGKRQYLDPTVEAVREHIRADIRRIRSWGYDLLKHDFSTYDLFGAWGPEMTDGPANTPDWHFNDRSKTNAEIVLDLYELIREECGDMLIIGCNTVSHLSAGLVQIARTGNDTSGRDWAPTKENGVNTLAFRLAQNKKFYLVDADCVGILGDNIPWEKNRWWLTLLAKSDSALFVSAPAELSEDKKADIAAAFADVQTFHDLRPIDRYENRTPEIWEADGKPLPNGSAEN
ncbi:MAG: alpha-galactosidase [Clostridia bacterium]|nr:alpha-galactosidase [Clostridia bacterium]